MKTQILAAIGEPQLQPLASLNAALAANDRVKFRFSLLQLALSHAKDPDQPVATLREERVACGIDDTQLDVVVANARMIGNSCHVDGAARIVVGIAEDMRLMAAPVLASNPDGLSARLADLLPTLPAAANDLLDPAAVSAMTEIGRTHADSLHQLLIDMHKQLNALQATWAEETLDGAGAYNLAAADRPLVLAFMKGVNRTAPLKFAHPGLSTTATRVGAQLVIQNDLGTTDAHVIVIHVTGLVTTITYTDVHPLRLTFFQRMLAGQSMTWSHDSKAGLLSQEPFYLTTGTAAQLNGAAQAVFLDYLGSRLVFLIDWNRAGKQLAGFLRSADRSTLLDWAAAAGIGHRGFLELGGAGPINAAIESTAGSSMHFGDRLCEVLGDAKSLEFMRRALRISTEGLLAGDSRALIQDRIRVALAGYFTNEERQLLRLAGEHAALVFEIAGLVQLGVEADSQATAAYSRRAATYGQSADQVIREVRGAVRRRPEFAVFGRMLEASDHAADVLEDAAFLLSIRSLEGDSVAVLQALADGLVDASQEWIKALAHAAGISDGDAAETEDFLTAIGRIERLEQQADDGHRHLATTALQQATDFRQLYLFTAVGAHLEAGAGGLEHASRILREHVLEDVIDD